MELQHLETQLARHQFDVLQAEISERQTAVGKFARTKSKQAPNDVLRCENEIAQLREQLSDLEHEVAAQQQRGLELKGEIDRHESRIQFNEERLRELASQNSKALGGHHAGRGTLPRRASRNWRASTERLGRRPKPRCEQHRERLQAKQRGVAAGRE